MLAVIRSTGASPAPANTPGAFVGSSRANLPISEAFPPHPPTTLSDLQGHTPSSAVTPASIADPPSEAISPVFLLRLLAFIHLLVELSLAVMLTALGESNAKWGGYYSFWFLLLDLMVFILAPKSFRAAEAILAVSLFGLPVGLTFLDPNPVITTPEGGSFHMVGLMIWGFGLVVARQYISTSTPRSVEGVVRAHWLPRYWETQQTTVFWLMSIIVLCAFSLLQHPLSLPAVETGVYLVYFMVPMNAVVWLVTTLIAEVRVLRKTCDTIGREKSELAALVMAFQSDTKRLKEKASCVATLAHEVRTPLNALLSCCSLLCDTTMTKEQIQFVQMITTCGAQIANNIDYVLESIRLEEGKVELEKKPFSLNNVCQECVQIVKHLADRKRLVLQFFGPSQPYMLLGDASRLKQALLNLLTNSIKFTHHGSVTLAAYATPQLCSDLVLSPRASGLPMFHSPSHSPPLQPLTGLASIRIEIIDTGIGMSLEQQSKLFQPFVQASRSTYGQFGGSGLGLVIARQLIQLMGGTVRIDPTRTALDMGSTFVVNLDLPLAPLLGGEENATVMMPLCLTPRADHVSSTTYGSGIPTPKNRATPPLTMQQQQQPLSILSTVTLPAAVPFGTSATSSSRTDFHDLNTSPAAASAEDALSPITIASQSQFIAFSPTATEPFGAMSGVSISIHSPTRLRRLATASGTQKPCFSACSSSGEVTNSELYHSNETMGHPGNSSSFRHLNNSRLLLPQTMPSSVPTSSETSPRSSFQSSHRTVPATALSENEGPPFDKARLTSSSIMMPRPFETPPGIAPTSSASESEFPSSASFVVSPSLASQFAAFHVLVVDDSQISNAIMTRVLKSIGFEHILSASSGHEALQAFVANQPIHLLVTDVNMPGMGGPELAQCIRKLSISSHPDIHPEGGVPRKWPVIVALSGAADDDVFERCFKGGIDAFLMKPISRNRLVQMATRWLLPPSASSDQHQQPDHKGLDSDQPREEDTNQELVLEKSNEDRTNPLAIEPWRRSFVAPECAGP